MKITIKLETDNAAFEDGNAGNEIGRILRTLASRCTEVDHHDLPQIACNLLDINGNTVGTVEVRV